MNVVQQNPNASVAAAVGAAVTLLVVIAGLFGVSVPAEAAAAVTTLAGSIVLLLGKNRNPAV